MLNGEDKNLSIMGQLVEETKELLRTRQEFKVTWVRREANRAADGLAKEGVSNKTSVYFPNFSPDCILHVVADEVPDHF